MFELKQESVSDKITRYQLLQNNSLLGYDEVIELWLDNVDFRLFFFEILINAPYLAYRFETPPISQHNAFRKFEFVLIDSPWLDVKPDKAPFADHINKAVSDIIDFENLGGDARLVVPCPTGKNCKFSHLATFMRNATQAHKHCLWQRVAKCMIEKISAQTIWLNTAGGGVDWLHVRLDSRPKYYAYLSYKHA